jgi:ABC-type antimicrobial peptide transport system permease subunit
VSGAKKREIFFQFITEAILISLLAAILSSLLFLALRPHALSLNPHLSNIISLSVTPWLVSYFVVLSISIGLLGGFLPALLLTRISPIQSLKNMPSIRAFPHVNLRKSLVAIQYTFSLLFIAITVIGYKQYRHFVTFDVGFKTEQIINIDVQGINPDLLMTELKNIPEITDICRSTSIINLDSYYKTLVTYGTPPDSLEVDYNLVDEDYLPLHEFKLLAGKIWSEGATNNPVIVNEQFLRSFGLDAGTPFTVLGSTVRIGRTDYEIVGVVKDFHYGGAERIIGPYLFMYSDKADKFVSVKVLPESSGVWLKLENAWRKIDPIHPIQAVYYSDLMERGYKDIAAMLKIIGFLSFLTVSIASLGLIGIVVFTTGSRTKEIGIRKVFGSSAWELIYILSKEFLLLLMLPVLLAVPSAFIFFDKIVLPKYAYHVPVSIIDLGVGVIIVLGIAFLVTSMQIWRAAHANPVNALRNE